MKGHKVGLQYPDGKRANCIVGMDTTTVIVGNLDARGVLGNFGHNGIKKEPIVT